MKKFLAILAAVLLVFAFAACSDDDDGGGTGGTLIFSEYFEGNVGNNKYLEIYNPTSANVDLSVYTLLYYGNGATDASITNGVTNGVADNLAPGGVIVLAHADADIYTGTIHQSYAYVSVHFFL